MHKSVYILHAVSMLILYVTMSIQMHKIHVYTLQMNMHFMHGCAYKWDSGLEWVQQSHSKIRESLYIYIYIAV